MSVILSHPAAASAEAARGVHAARLPGDPAWLLDRLPDLGPVVLEAGNAGARLAVDAELAAPCWCGGQRLLPGPGAELRALPGIWQSAFTLSEGAPDQRREELRFLDGEGEVALAAKLTAGSDRAAFHDLAAPALSEPPAPADGGEPVDGGITRVGRLASRVDPVLVPELLETLADAAIPLRMVLPGRGLWLAATALIGNPLRRVGGLVVHGAGLRLQVEAGALAGAALRRVPAGDGQAHALDLCDAGGSCMLRLMGQAVPGRPEDGAWRTLMGALRPAV
jgi:putative heme degradation protein